MKEKLLDHIIWGNRLFVNAQFLVNMLTLIGKYQKKYIAFQDLVNYSHAILDQKKVKIYKQLKTELKEFFAFEKEQKQMDEKTRKSVENYICDRFINIFAKGKN